MYPPPTFRQTVQQTINKYHTLLHILDWLKKQEYYCIKVMQEFIPYNCEPIQVLEKDPVPVARKAVSDVRRLHPDVNILPEVISATIRLSCAEWIAQALTINVAYKLAAEKEGKIDDCAVSLG